MDPIKHILVATDFSPSADAAFAHALVVAERFGARIDVLHAWEPATYVHTEPLALEAAQLERLLREGAEAQAQAGFARMQAASDARGVTLTRRIEPGPPHAAILRVAESCHHDLIALGTHGRTGAIHALLGSVAARVVRHASMPVLTAHSGTAAVPHIRRILVPTDFSEGARRALECALAWAAACGAIVDVLHVWEEPPGLVGYKVLPESNGEPVTVRDFLRVEGERGMAALREEAARGGLPSFGQRIESGRADAVIAEVARKDAYDLIVMGTVGRTGLERFLIGSVAEAVVRCAPCAVLTVRAPERRRRGIVGALNARPTA